jgi:hypothetical protein
MAAPDRALAADSAVSGSNRRLRARFVQDQ